MKSSNDKMISDANGVKEFYSFSLFALKTFGEVLSFTKDQYAIFKEFVIRFHEKREKRMRITLIKKFFLALGMAKLGRNEKVVTLGVFALGLAAMSLILIAPIAIAQDATSTPAAQLSHTESIQPNVTEPVYVSMNSNDYITAGITHSTSRNTADVIVNEEGSYLIVAAGQVGKTSGNSTCNVDLWLRHNGEHVENSNTRASVPTTNDTIVLVSQAIMPLKPDDTINTMMSVSASDQGCGLINTKPSSEPNIPAIIFSMIRIGN